MLVGTRVEQLTALFYQVGLQGELRYGMVNVFLNQVLLLFRSLTG